MKLDNRGWGLTEMLVWCGVLLFFLLVAVFFIMQLSEALDSHIINNNNDDYINSNSVEGKIEIASLNYMKDYYSEEIGNNTVTITVKNLKENNYLSLNDLSMNTEKICDGYALITKCNKALVSHAFVDCGNYVTSGFQDWRIGA